MFLGLNNSLAGTTTFTVHGRPAISFSLFIPIIAITYTLCHHFLYSLINPLIQSQVVFVLANAKQWPNSDLFMTDELKFDILFANFSRIKSEKIPHQTITPITANNQQER